MIAMIANEQKADFFDNELCSVQYEYLLDVILIDTEFVS